MEIGVQIYSLRDFCQTLEDFSETLKKVADMGYNTVQVSGTCAYEADWLKNELDKNGLKCVLTHVSPTALFNELDKVVADHNVFGCDNIGIGWYGFDDTKEKYDEFLRLFLPVAKGLCERGKYFMYHNHDQEFNKIDDKLVLQKLTEDFAPNEMGFILDTFWVQAGGGDPAWWLEKLNGRVPCIHLKDYAYGRKVAVLGEGNLNFDRIFEKAESSGTEYMLVEQDEYFGDDPFDCMKRSYKYLKSRGF